ncbi:ictacalcin-like [Clinocottus analis]|uniref:ictacalcin-like n=1 Tax=Clinocottus analis TaxID=304258 RepID=UPI0035C108B4
MSDIQQAMALLIHAFETYAGTDTDKDTMTKEELKEMLQKEFGGNAIDQKAVDCAFQTMDANKDNSVDFKEFVTMVACLTMSCHQHFKKNA